MSTIMDSFCFLKAYLLKFWIDKQIYFNTSWYLQNNSFARLIEIHMSSKDSFLQDYF